MVLDDISFNEYYEAGAFGYETEDAANIALESFLKENVWVEENDFELYHRVYQTEGQWAWEVATENWWEDTNVVSEVRESE